MENIINSGALGVEIIISGKIPSARAKSWRFYQGYLKKCGDIAISGVRNAKTSALLKSGIVGVKVAIMPPDLILPDRVEILSELLTKVEEISSPLKNRDVVSEDEPKKTTKKRSSSPRKKKEVKTERVISSVSPVSSVASDTSSDTVSETVEGQQ